MQITEKNKYNLNIEITVESDSAKRNTRKLIKLHKLKTGKYRMRTCEKKQRKGKGIESGR